MADVQSEVEVTRPSRPSQALHGRTTRWSGSVAVGLALALSIVPAVLIARQESWTTPDGVTHWTLFDDAMISMSYGRTLAEGGGFAWFPGAARVEGVTNLGWTLVMAAVHRVGLSGDRAVIAMKVLGLLTVWLTAVFAVLIGRSFRGTDTPVARFCIAAVIVGNAGLLFWAVQGMEVGVLTMLTLLTCLLASQVLDRPSPRATFALGAVVLAGVVTRIDFAVIPLAVLAWAVVTDRRTAFERIARPVVVGTAVGIAGPMIFRLAYFGQPVPNTYYLKLTGVPLTTQLTRGVVVTGAAMMAYLVPAGLIVVAFWRRLLGAEQRLLGLLLSVAAAQSLYCLYVGGDAWENYLVPDRYHTPAVTCVLLAAVLAAVAGGLAPSGARHHRLAIAALVVLPFVGPLVGAALLRQASERVPWLGGFSFPVDGAPVTPGAALIVGVLTWSPAPHRGAGLAVATILTLAVIAGPGVSTELGSDRSNAVFGALASQIAEVTTPDAIVAVAAAGALQYVTGLACVDLLGKMDEHIARLPAATSLYLPGHNKWDYAHTLGTLRPDLVVQFRTTPDRGLPNPRDFGYRPMQRRTGSFIGAIHDGGRWVVWVRDDSPFVRRDRLVPVP